MTTTYKWNGNYVFHVSGSDLHEDTLKVKSSYSKQEHNLSLVLPTLCITYADAKFQNSIGGKQLNYPASSAYGPKYFEPPVEIVGEAKIEKYTYIRGARRVIISSKDTIIEFPSWKELVIPRLRIDKKEKTEVVIKVPETNINIDNPLKITARQYADGRSVGGVRLEKRHPEWKPIQKKEVYDLWLRVLDGLTHQPIRKARVDISCWDPTMITPYGTGGFRLDTHSYTDSHGYIKLTERPSGRLEAYVVKIQGRRSVARCIRPLTGQVVRMHMMTWPLEMDTMEYIIQKNTSIEELITLTGHTLEDFLKANHIHDLSGLRPGTKVNLPCYSGIYFLESWDTIDWVSKEFGYGDISGLGKANGITDMDLFAASVEIKLPDWKFLFAREKDDLIEIDEMFGLPKGSSRPVGLVYHPNSSLITGEAIAVPSPEFAKKMRQH